MKRVSLIIMAALTMGLAVAQPSVALPDSLSSMRRIETIAAMPDSGSGDEALAEGTHEGDAAKHTMDKQQAEAMWDEANQLYIDNKIDEALQAYLTLCREGYVSAPLYYNTANAYYRTGDIGRAILYYRRALRIIPSWDDARHNLKIAEQQCKDNIEALPEMFITRIARSIRDMLSGLQWSIVSIVAFAAMLIFAIIFFVGERIALRRVGFYGAIAATLLFVATTAAAMSIRSVELSRSEAVVIGKSISVKSSPDRAATDIFVLHEGTIVNVDNEIDEWVEVTIANGNKGWTLTKNIERI